MKQAGKFYSLNVLLLSLLVIPVTSCEAGTPFNRQFPERVVLNVTADPTHSMAVNWRTAQLVAEPAVQLALAIDAPQLESNVIQIKAEVTPLQIKGDSGVFQYAAIMTGLQPKTIYAYRVGNAKHWSEWSQFKTAAEQAEPFRFLYVGDPQFDITAYVSRIFRAAYAAAPDAAFLLCPGDIVNDGDDDDLWGEIFYAAGWIPKMVPFVPTVGNHEYKSNPKRLTPLYRPQFNLPLNGPCGVAESAYYFDYQGVRVVMLNSNELIHEQARWLDSLLALNPQRWTILAMHHPLYPIASNRDYTDLRNAFLPVIERHNVDLVLAGHDHAYARSYKLRGGQRVTDNQPGTYYFVSVCGPKQYKLESKFLDLYAKTATNHQMYQVVTVSRAQLQVQTFSVTGRLVDEIVLRK